MKKLVILMFLFCSCAASNKRHWQKIHPKGGWAGRNYIKPDSSLNKK